MRPGSGMLCACVHPCMCVWVEQGQKSRPRSLRAGHSRHITAERSSGAADTVLTRCQAHSGLRARGHRGRTHVLYRRPLVRGTDGTGRDGMELERMAQVRTGRNGTDWRRQDRMG